MHRLGSHYGWQLRCGLEKLLLDGAIDGSFLGIVIIRLAMAVRARAL